MKQSITTCLVVVLALLATTAQAQQMSIKTGLAYSASSTITDQSLGIMYGFDISDDKVAISADFNYFFDEVGEDKYSPFAFNLDIQYTVWTTGNGKYSVYPIAGMNYGNYYDTGRPGFSLGLGSRYKINSNVAVFSEAKHVFGRWDGTYFNVGVRLNTSRD